MLEIPESATVSRQIRETCAGRTIERVTAAHSPHGFAWYCGDPSVYPRLLEGGEITGAQAVAGYVRIDASGVTILLHDGVNARHLAPGAVEPKKHQLLIRFDDGSGIVCTVQMYGGLYAFPQGEMRNPYYDAALAKPHPFSEGFDERHFESIVSNAPGKLSAKGLLATEQRIPGLGNGCLQDILFRAGVNPQSKLSALSDEDIAAIFTSLKTTLREMADSGGRNTERDLFGEYGGYRTLMSSKTVSRPCPDCGKTLERKTYMGGNVYFCPSCQPLKPPRR